MISAAEAKTSLAIRRKESSVAIIENIGKRLAAKIDAGNCTDTSWSIVLNETELLFADDILTHANSIGWSTKFHGDLIEFGI